MTHIYVSWEQQAELRVAVEPSVAGAAYSGVNERIVEVLGQLMTSRLEMIEAAIKFQKVAWREGEWKKYCHGWKECSYVGKGATGGTAAYCMPADGEGAAEAMHNLALCQIFQVAADDGAEASAAAVAEYGAPAMLAGGESDDDIDVSAYGFTVSDSGSGVLTELETLTSQVKAMEENVGACEHLSIDEFLAGSWVEELAPSDSETSFVEAPDCASAVRRQQVVGCGAPPFGLRPHFIIMLACFIDLLAFGIAGVAVGFAGGEIDGIDNNDNIYNSVTIETPVMCVGHVL
ncbi:hypothetical protein CYMTET_51204 [Cymbomonas tetramitiformis]|uniref:Uncharacterized protein n=1 Tax=Cymbomonas tetramitiformis TaxID=36881 RepID=A0AAE0BLR5_9CHLO|nr:hypothetical protein CYMTET_51204 [Cymbomonas tetramitiformis]